MTQEAERAEAEARLAVFAEFGKMFGKVAQQSAPNTALDAYRECILATERAKYTAPSDEVLDAMIAAWFGNWNANTDQPLFRKRMRAALAALES